MRDEIFLTVNDAAKILDRCGEAVRGYERRGELRALKTLGGVRLFKESDVRAFAQKLNRKTEERGTG